MLRTRVAVVALVRVRHRRHRWCRAARRVGSRRPALSRLGFFPGGGGAASLRSLESWLGRDTHYVMHVHRLHRRLGVREQHLGRDRARRRRTRRSRTARTSSSRCRSRSVSASAPTPRSVPPHSPPPRPAATTPRSASARSTSRARDFAGVTIRLGWEFDGNWMPWSAAGNEALWVQAYRHVHDVFKSIIPNARFDWTGDVGWMPREIERVPGRRLRRRHRDGRLRQEPELAVEPGDALVGQPGGRVQHRRAEPRPSSATSRSRTASR